MKLNTSLAHIWQLKEKFDSSLFTLCVTITQHPEFTNPSSTPQGGFTSKSNSFSHLES